MTESTLRVDATVLALSREVKSLDDNLKSLSRTLQGCQSQALVLMHMNDDIWRSIESNLHDCGEALDELQTLVDDIKRPVPSRNLFKRPTLAMRLSTRKREIAESQDKISKSNSAMQTAVGIVSLYGTCPPAKLYHSDLFQITRAKTERLVGKSHERTPTPPRAG